MKKITFSSIVFIAIGIVVLIFCFFLSLLVGQYPINWAALPQKGMDWRVFTTLRIPRTCMAMLSGIVLSIAGSVYQKVFQNPLAAPDIIGVSSGSSVGAAIAILFAGGGIITTALFAFMGGILAVCLVLFLSLFTSKKGMMGIVLTGIAVNAFSQAVLMLLKLTADPEKHLASIEFWIMGSFADATLQKFIGTILFVVIGVIGVFLLYRQILILSLGDVQAKSLGVSVQKMRCIILLFATLITSAVVSVTGLISFVGLIAPHIAKLILKTSNICGLILSGIIGGILLLTADIISRSVGTSEIPVSIITSLLGAPCLFFLLGNKEQKYE